MADFGWVGPAITATDNLLSRFESHWQNNKNREFAADQANEQRVWESAEAEKARDWQSREWQRQFDAQNAYNTPSAQMARLKEAGLNPFLNQSSVGSGSSVSVPSTPSSSAPSGASASAPPISTPMLHDVGLGFTQARAVDAQNANALAQSFKTSVEAAKDLWTISPKLAKNFLSEAAKRYGQDSNAFSMFSQRFELDMRNKDLENERIELANSLTKKFGSKQAERQLDLIDNQIVHIVASIGKMASDAKVNDSEIKKLASDVAKNFAEAGLFNVQAGQIKSFLPYLINKLSFENGTAAMNFLENSAEFGANQSYFEWLGTDKAKQSRKMSKVFDSQNNAFNKFMQELMKMIPTGSVPAMMNNSGKSSQTFGWYGFY